MRVAYVAPEEFVTKVTDAGESRVFVSIRDTLIRACVAGAILAPAAAIAVTATVQTGQPPVGTILVPVGFCLLCLLGLDLLTGALTRLPLALTDKRPGVTIGGMPRNRTLVFSGNLAGARTVAATMLASVPGKVFAMRMPILLPFRPFVVLALHSAQAGTAPRREPERDPERAARPSGAGD